MNKKIPSSIGFTALVLVVLVASTAIISSRDTLKDQSAIVAVSKIVGVATSSRAVSTSTAKISSIGTTTKVVEKITPADNANVDVALKYLYKNNLIGTCCDVYKIGAEADYESIWSFSLSRFDANKNSILEKSELRNLLIAMGQNAIIRQTIYIYLGATLNGGIKEVEYKKLVLGAFEKYLPKFQPLPLDYFATVD